jgi:hypothetical protein
MSAPNTKISASTSVVARRAPTYTTASLHVPSLDLVELNIIYCSSVGDTKGMGKLLQCSAYYREMNTDEDKSHMVQANEPCFTGPLSMMTGNPRVRNKQAIGSQSTGSVPRWETPKAVM